MKVLDEQTFLYLGDKNVSKVSGVWKALHLSLFVLIAVNAFITSMAIGNMFQTFKYNCILFCTDVGFEREILQPDYFDSKIGQARTTNASNVGGGDVDTDNYEVTQNIGESLAINNTTKNITELSISSTTAPITNNESDIEVVSKDNNNTLIYKNETHIFLNEDDSIVLIHGRIDLRKTQFGPNFWCNFVLGVALMTFIFATFYAVMLAMCSKGGKGRTNTLNRPQNMIYPVLLSSLILGVLNLTASVAVKNGMKDFCANFQIFTEEERCSSMINQFTIHERQNGFYLPYVVLSHSFTITNILFVCQILVTTLRIIYAVDYQLYALKVEDTENEEDDLVVEDGHIKERTL